MASNDPKPTLTALLEGAALPFPSTELDTARALAAAPEQAPAAAVEALPETLALAVLEAAVQRRSSSLPEALSSSSNKSLAKAAKKALYRLRSLGVAVAPPAAERSAAPGPEGDAPEEVPPALLSAVTGTGERALILARLIRGGLETAHLVLSDERGVTHLAIHEASRGMYRRQLKEVRAGRTPPAIELPLEEAKERLATAVFLNDRSGTARPDGLTELLRHLELTPKEPPDLTAALASADAGADDVAQDGIALHAEKELAEWLPDESQLRALGEIWERLGPAERLDRPRVEALFREAAQAYFTPAIRALYAGRLAQMADFFARTGRPDPARIAQAQARALARDGALPSFAQELFVKVIHLTEKALAQAPDTPAARLRPPPIPPASEPAAEG